MSHQEKNNIVSIICNLLINGFVILKLNAMFGDGSLSGPDAPMVWARMVIWVIPASIVLLIALTILSSIVVAIIERDPKPDFTVDERDKLFDIRGMGATMAVVAAGFIGSIIALAVGWQPLTVFIMIYFSFALGSIVGDLVKFLSYRYGG